MKSKPALKVLALYVTGLLVARHFDPHLAILFFLSIFPLFIAFTLWYAEKGNLHFRDVCLITALVAVGILRYQLATDYLPRNHISHFTNHRQPVALSGLVTNYPERRVKKTNLTIAVNDIFFDGEVYETQGKVLVSVREWNRGIGYGNEIIVRGKLRKPRDRRNPGEFDYRAYLAAQGIYGIMNVDKTSQIEVLSSDNGNWFLSDLVYPAKSYLDNYVQTHFPAQEAVLLRGLLIGERGEVPFELREAFSQLGVIHILAVSGLHVGFIILIFMGVFGFFRIPQIARVFLTLAALVFYAYLTNLKPPVVRASIMGGLLLLGMLLERNTDVFNILAVAALIILAVNPLELFQSGFQLSFAAVTSIVYFYPRLRRVFAVKKFYDRCRNSVFARYPVELFLVSLAAFLGTLPFTILYFNRLPNFSLFANLLIVPLSFGGLASAMVASVLNLLIPPLAEMYQAAAWFFLHILIETVKWASQLPLAFKNIYQFSMQYALFYYAGLLFLVNLKQKRTRRWFIIYLLILTNLFVWRSIVHEDDILTVTYLDVGQGDAVLVAFPDGLHALVDGGPRSLSYDAGKWVIEPYLKRQGIRDIDVMILSHADSDHLGGLPHLLRRFPVHEVWDNGDHKDTELYREYLGLIDSLNIRHRIMRAGEVLDEFAPVHIFVLHPTERFLEGEKVSANDGSLSLRISYGQVDMILAGDVEEDGEWRIARFGKLLESEILKVNHHGSRTSSTQKFLNLVQPQLAIISVGELNKFDHPHPEVLHRLRAIGAKVLRTDQHAAVILKTDGEEIEMVDWK